MINRLTEARLAELLKDTRERAKYDDHPDVAIRPLLLLCMLEEIDEYRKAMAALRESMTYKPGRSIVLEAEPMSVRLDEASTEAVAKRVMEYLRAAKPAGEPFGSAEGDTIENALRALVIAEGHPPVAAAHLTAVYIQTHRAICKLETGGRKLCMDLETFELLEQEITRGLSSDPEVGRHVDRPIWVDVDTRPDLKPMRAITVEALGWEIIYPPPQWVRP